MMIKSVITIPVKMDLNGDGIEERIKEWDWTDEILIPKVIGLIKTTITGILRYRRLLPIGHRLRQIQEEL
jgi:hypothetical protein